VSTEPDAPAAGIRVLDLTRVIAGPVATRTLALWGADVLRIDGPRHPEIEAQHLDTGAGKRSAILDLDDRDALEGLLADADVVVTGYRPGSLDRFGLSPEALAERHPGVVIARLSAWGTAGPFADRRGFDSIVQAASGIGWIESIDGAKPGALPAQALDHSAGYLLAAAITTALRRQLDEGGSWLVETSLARVAQELLAAPRTPRAQSESWEPTVATHGDLTTALPAAHYDGGPGDWRSPTVPWGSSEPHWK
jgi:crotonobetainyl-CoA:carnitine CoA-transferase CaiB-like acyl-CoA transferase